MRTAQPQNGHDAATKPPIGKRLTRLLQENSELSLEFFKKIGSNPLLQNQKLQIDFKNPFRILADINKINNKIGDKNILNKKPSSALAELDDGGLYKNSITKSKCIGWRRGQDSNLRELAPNTLSKRAP